MFSPRIWPGMWSQEALVVGAALVVVVLQVVVVHNNESVRECLISGSQVSGGGQVTRMSKAVRGISGFELQLPEVDSNVHGAAAFTIIIANSSYSS